MTRPKYLWRAVGIIGAVACIVGYALHPSFPTADKLLVFLVFVFMIVGQGWELFKRLGPFVALLLAYDSFRGLIPSLTSRVAYTSLPDADKFLFGSLPTVTLQHWLWHGHLSWYDYIFYGAYLLHFVLPVGLAVLVWKTRERWYWRLVATYVTVSLGGFLTFLLYPAAPPWLAAQKGLIPPITRISSQVYAAFGLHGGLSVYQKISPDNVAALPSLHAAYATLLLIFVTKLYGKKWGLLALTYPLLIWFGTVYMGEHYAIDEIAGVIYAVAGYLLVGRIIIKISAYRETSASRASARGPSG
jgi:hypothetical protein